jgi:hypothetical protein
MTKLHDLFVKPSQYDHPKLRSWLSYKNKASVVGSYVEFRRERDGLVFKPAVLYFVAVQTDDTEYCDSEPWDAALNDALLKNGFRARNAENEGERFGYRLVGLLQPIVNKFGDGYFNSVLVRYLEENGYTSDEVIRGHLTKIQTHPPLGSQHVADCQARIDGVLAQCAGQLTGLGYSPQDSSTILCGALAYYLDERFHLTNRKILGW